MASWNRLSGPVQQANDASTSKQQLRRASVASLLPLLGSAAVARLTWHREDNIHWITEVLHWLSPFLWTSTTEGGNKPVHPGSKAHSGRQTLVSLQHPAAAIPGYLVAAWLLLLCASQIMRAVRRRSPSANWEKSLGPTQRKLLGLPTQPQRQLMRPAGAAAAAASPDLICGPPMRGSRSLASQQWGTPGISKQAEAGGSPHTPHTPTMQRGRAHSLHQGSPLTPPSIVTTPSQLKSYLNVFEDRAREGDESPGSAQQPTASPFGSRQQGLGNWAPPKYQPALQPKGRTSPRQTDGRLLPSSTEAVEALLARLKCSRQALDDWTDRLREWFAGQVLQPLTHLLDTAHLEVAQKAGALGWAGLHVQPLGLSAAAQGARRGQAATDAGQLRQQLLQLLSQNGGTHTQQTPLLMACLQAVVQYQRLEAVLQGLAPAGLLPPAPQSYLLARIQQLAEGPCMTAFHWNGGGSFNNGPWTPDLPTDSSLLLYLFSAFLEAPRWQFAWEGAAIGAVGSSALLFGTLPPSPPETCDAVLSSRPAAFPERASAILALGLASQQPHFTLVAEGTITITISHYLAVFHIILLFLQHAKLETMGQIGGRSLHYLMLRAVLKQPLPLSLLPAKWLGLW